MNNLIASRKVLAVFAVAIFILAAVTVAVPVRANPGTLYVDALGVCGGNSPCYTHPQDAVNFANPGDTILVYPGTYDSRVYTTKPPHYGPNDQYAPALIVYKDGLTIQAVDPDPSVTVIQSTHNYWSNPVAIQASTGGTWDGTKYVGAGVNPNFGTASSAVIIIANHVTFRGFTLHRHFEGTWATYNTAGVFIGALCAGCSQYLGAHENTVEDCVFSDVWHAVYIWHSSGNTIVNNNVASLSTNHWAAISVYDGDTDAKIALGYLSENNLIAHNILANKGIALGAWAPLTWTSNAGSQVCCNTVTQVGVTYAHGPVIIGCNTGGFWQVNTDKVLRIKGVSYTGDTELLFSSGDPVSVNLLAKLDYDGSADGSAVQVTFTVGGTQYSATTVAGGIATTTASLLPGTYTVETKVTVCPDCEFKDSTQLATHYLLTISVSPPGTGTATPDPAGSWYDSGTKVSVTATPASGYTFGSWLLDDSPAGSTNPIAVTMNAPHNLVAQFLSPKTIKQNVLDDLIALRATVIDKQDGKKLDEAIKHLTKSLNPDLWVDETHLQPKHGDKVFQEEKDAVVKLLELIKDKKSNVDKAKLQDFINRLVEADKLLALVAIEGAVAASGDAKKIDKANDELGKGDARVADGHFTDAIEHYRNAWKHAIQSV